MQPPKSVTSLLNQNPLFFFSQKIQPSSLAYNLCTWGALIITLFVTFHTIIKSLNFLLVKYQHKAPTVGNLIHDVDDYSDTDEEDETTSSLSSSEFEDDEEEDEAAGDRKSEQFRLGGSTDSDGGFIQRYGIGDLFSLAEITHSKSVVKLWDTLGLGLGLGLGFGGDHSGSYDVVSFFDNNEEEKLVVFAEESASGNLALMVWDTRLRRRLPEVIAEWGPTSVGKMDGVESDRAQKVYVRDDGRYGLNVGDIRNVRSPLENVTERNVDTCWPNSFMLNL